MYEKQIKNELKLWVIVLPGINKMAIANPDTNANLTWVYRR